MLLGGLTLVPRPDGRPWSYLVGSSPSAGCHTSSSGPPPAWQHVQPTCPVIQPRSMRNTCAGGREHGEAEAAVSPGTENSRCPSTSAERVMAGGGRHSGSGPITLHSGEPSRHISCLQPACLLPPPLFPTDTGRAEPSQHQQPRVPGICSLNSGLAGLSSLYCCGGSPRFTPEDGCGTAACWGRHVKVWKGQTGPIRLSLVSLSRSPEKPGGVSA